MVPASSTTTPETEPVSTLLILAEISPLPIATEVSRSKVSLLLYSVPSFEIVVDESNCLIIKLYLIFSVEDTPKIVSPLTNVPTTLEI